MKSSLLLIVVFVLVLTAILISPAMATQYNPPWAHNYDFLYPDSDTRPCALLAKNNLSSINYNAYATTNSNYLSAFNNFKDDAVFFFIGHGFRSQQIPGLEHRGGAITFWDGNQYTLIAAQNNGYWPTYEPSKYITNYTTELKDVLLVVYAACYTGRTHYNLGNLVDKTFNYGGADYVIGFTDEVNESHIKYWADRFWYRCTYQRIKDANEGAKVEVVLKESDYGGVNLQNLKYRLTYTEYIYPARYGVI